MVLFISVCDVITSAIFHLLWVSEFYRTTYWTLFVIGLFAACCNFNFGESEIGKVSTIYIEEYRKLQGPKLSKRRFIDNFTVIPFFNKIQKLFHKDKREGNDDL